MKKTFISLVFAAVLLAGCSESSDYNNNSENEEIQHVMNGIDEEIAAEDKIDQIKEAEEEIINNTKELNNALNEL